MRARCTKCGVLLEPQRDQNQNGICDSCDKVPGHQKRTRNRRKRIPDPIYRFALYNLKFAQMGLIAAALGFFIYIAAKNEIEEFKHTALIYYALGIPAIIGLIANFISTLKTGIAGRIFNDLARRRHWKANYGVEKEDDALGYYMTAAAEFIAIVMVIPIAIIYRQNGI